MATRKKVAIIGAGICGVSSAICLQQADPTLELTIISEKFSPDLTSDGAAGFWEPMFLKDTPAEKQRKWGKATYDYLKAIADTEEAYSYQIHYITAYLLADHHNEPSPFKDIFSYCHKLSKEDLKRNFPPNIIDGSVVKSIMFPGTPYLNIKLKEFQQKGGKIIQKKVNSFDEFVGNYDIVINCAGLGAYELCNDKNIRPLRGQVLKMKAPWIKQAYVITREHEEKKGLTTYIFPRFNDVVVGGTIQSDNWDTNINDEDTKAIIERAAEFVPTIKDAVLIKAWAGLRPSRDAIRVEKEMIDVSSKHGTKMKLEVVHNYGHGGAGLSIFWGCALEVRDIVLTSLLNSSL